MSKKVLLYILGTLNPITYVNGVTVGKFCLLFHEDYMSKEHVNGHWIAFTYTDKNKKNEIKFDSKLKKLSLNELINFIENNKTSFISGNFFSRMNFSTFLEQYTVRIKNNRNLKIRVDVNEESEDYTYLINSPNMKAIEIKDGCKIILYFTRSDDEENNDNNDNDKKKPSTNSNKSCCC